MSADTMRELVIKSVEGNKAIQLEVIDLILSYNDSEEALKLVNHFSIPEDEWPSTLKYQLVSQLN